MIESYRCPHCHLPWMAFGERSDHCPYCGSEVHYRTLAGFPPGRVPAAPFREWLASLRATKTEAARAIGCDPTWLTKARTFDERLIENAGLALADDPRLTEALYPHLGEVQ